MNNYIDYISLSRLKQLHDHSRLIFGNEINFLNSPAIPFTPLGGGGGGAIGGPMLVGGIGGGGGGGMAPAFEGGGGGGGGGGAATLTDFIAFGWLPIWPV